MSVSEVTEFVNDDQGYLEWINQNPSGYVLNTTQYKAPTYMILHRAACRHISERKRSAPPGAFTERAFVKICAADVARLRVWASNHGRNDGSFTSEHCYCLKYL